MAGTASKALDICPITVESCHLTTYSPGGSVNGVLPRILGQATLDPVQLDR